MNMSVRQLLFNLPSHFPGAVSMGKLTLVDLAGSERAAKTGATGDRLKEAQSERPCILAAAVVLPHITAFDHC